MTRWGRFLRGWSAAIFATFVAAFSHVFAGGGHPPLFAVALALAFSGMVCVFLAGKRLSRLRIAVSIIFSQIVYHALFSLFGASATAAQEISSGQPAAAIAHQHAGHAMLLSVSDGLGSTQLIGSQFNSFDSAMLLAHAAAAAMTLVIIFYGQSLMAGLATTARLILKAIAGRMLWLPVPFAPKLCTATGNRTAVPRDLTMLVSRLRYRGPPRLLHVY